MTPAQKGSKNSDQIDESMQKLLRAIDAAAFTVSLIAVIVLVGGSLLWALLTAVKAMFSEIVSMLHAPDDRIILAVVAVCMVWCAFRWKALNSP